VKLKLYAGQGCWIIVPDVILPPKSSEFYGPLAFQGYIRTRNIEEATRNRMADEIDQRLFARFTFDELPHPAPTELPNDAGRPPANS